MRDSPYHLDPVVRPDHIFGSRAVIGGGVVRRSVRDVELIVGRELFREALRRRGYRDFENRDQFVIYCNRDPVGVLKWRV